MIENAKCFYETRIGGPRGSKQVHSPPIIKSRMTKLLITCMVSGRVFSLRYSEARAIIT